jgi:hypothetical protein
MGPRPVARTQDLHLLVIERRGKILLRQRHDKSQRLAGFWELPEREQVPDATIHKDSGVFRHTIVHTTYLVRVYRASVRSTLKEFQWMEKTALLAYPLSTIAKKALALAPK